MKARKTIANAVREVSTLADQLIMVLGPRLEPMDSKSFLTISELCTKILWPFQAVPELLDAGTAYNAAAQKELDDMWHRLGANTADDLKRLCELCAPSVHIMSRPPNRRANNSLDRSGGSVFRIKAWWGEGCVNSRRPAPG